jgi:hypothetical protein
LNTNLYDYQGKETNPTYKIMAGPTSTGIYDKIGSMETKVDAKKVMRKGLAMLSYLAPEFLGVGSPSDLYKADVYAFGKEFVF